MYLSRGLVLIVFQFLTGIYPYDVIHGNPISDMPVKNETVFASGIKYVTSHGFPTACCQSATYAVAFDDLFPVGDCMHLMFEDLDLPPNASLVVTEVAEDNQKILLDFGLRLSHKPKGASSVTLCDVIRTCNRNSTLWVILEYQGSPSLLYIGFRARVWTTSLKNSVRDASFQSVVNSSPTVPCQVLTMVSSGQEVSQRISSKEAVLDYIWLVKLPTDLNTLNNFVVFTRIISAQFDGDLEVREGVASDANVLLRKSVTASENSLSRTSLFSEHGFHIRLRVPPNVSNAHFHFVTGVRRISYVDTHEDYWIACHNSSWMILDRYKCDNIQHCPMGEDEDLAICIVTLSPPTESLSFLKWLMPLIAGFLLMGLVLSMLKLYMKSKYRNQDRCASTEVHHPVSSAQLPLLHIPSQLQCGPTTGRSSAIYIPPNPRRPTSDSGETLRSGSSGATAPRSGAIRIPMSRNPAAAAMFIVRPQVHHEALPHPEGHVLPPSYEEATADVSFGDSSDSLEELEHLPEYHPPSYEDASQGKMGVSSWVSSSAQPILP